MIEVPTTRAAADPARTAAPPASGDQLLDGIFTDDKGGDQPLPDVQAVGAANKQIVVAVYGLHVPAITAAQEQELTGNGSPDLRPASVAYQALLQRRPHLGAAKGVTPERFQQVIEKDRAYDTLGATTAAVQSATTGATARAEAQVTSDVATVAAYVGPRTDPANFTDNENITEHFAPVQTQLQRIEDQEKSRDQRQANQAQSITADLAGHVEQQAALPNLGRLTEAAGRRIDLLAHPAAPAAPTGSDAGTRATAGTPKKPAQPPKAKKPGKTPGPKPGATTGKRPGPKPAAKATAASAARAPRQPKTTQKA